MQQPTEVQKKGNMREVKFRAWYPQRRIMYTWQEISIESMGVFISRIDGDENSDYSLTPDAILMQFIGLYDKSDQEIYEGDILEADYNVSERRHSPLIIKWVTSRYKNGWNIGGNGKIFKVIGNIYENPELLEDNA